LNELSALDLGIAPDIAGALQFVAADQLGFVVPLPASAALLTSGVLVLFGWSRRSARHLRT
jgi:hypothetical protein